MEYNKGFGLVAIVLIVAGVLVVGGGVYYLNNNNKYETSKEVADAKKEDFKLNDSIYLKSEDILIKNEISREKYNDFQNQCVSGVTNVKLSSKSLGVRCNPRKPGCQSAVPRLATVCGNKYVIYSFYLSGAEEIYGIFELE